MDHSSPRVQLDHIAVAVPDLERSIAWYRDTLGFEEIERRLTTGVHTGMRSAVMRAGSAVVVLLEGTSAESQISKFVSAYGPGVQHFAIEVENLDVAMQKFGCHDGVADTKIITGDGIRQIFLRRSDLSGARVELIERRGGTFGDDSVRELFLAFEAADLF